MPFSLVDRNLVTLVFVSLHSNGNYLCQYQFSAPGSVRTAAKKQGVECALVDSVTVRKSADVRVLSCSAGEVCVKDSTSTMGGRCEFLVFADDEAAALEPQRER